MQPKKHHKHNQKGKASSWTLPGNSAQLEKKSGSVNRKPQSNGALVSEAFRTGSKAKASRAGSRSSTSKASLTGRSKRVLVAGEVSVKVKESIMKVMGLWGWPAKLFVELAILEWMQRRKWGVRQELMVCNAALRLAEDRKSVRYWTNQAKAQRLFLAWEASRREGRAK